MQTSLDYLIYTAVLCWLALLLGALLRAGAWRPKGMLWALGNREQPPPSGALAGRATRAGQNTLENLLLFGVLLFAVHAAGGLTPRVEQASAWFFWSRVGYLLVYLAGVPYLRTLVWLVGVWALAVIAWAGLHAPA